MKFITKKLLLVLWVLTSFKFIFNELYLYPVAKNNEAVFYIYQKGLSDLELWRLQFNSCKIEKCLYWRFAPVGFKLLPDCSSFSFIDCGQIKIKNFNKRSPHTVDFNQLICGICEVNWLDCSTCYFSAKQKNRSAIFVGKIDNGHLKAIHQSSLVDHLSPKIVGHKLFWIERNLIDRSANIKMQPIKIVNNLDLDFLNQPEQIILDCNYQQIIYLEMLSEKLGFYIEHMPYINNDSQIITFICYKITYIESENIWQTTKLFKFNILKRYLFGDHRLLESFLPFLPRAEKTTLYFVDIKQNDSSEWYSSICSFGLLSGEFETVLNSNPNIIFFAPLISNDKLFYGQVLQKELN